MTFINKIRHGIKMTWTMVLTFALCLTSMGVGNVLPTMAATLPDSVTELSSGTPLPNIEEMFTFDYSTMDIQWGDAYNDQGKEMVATMSGPTSGGDAAESYCFCLPLENTREAHTYTDVITFTQPNVMKVNGEYVDFTLSVDEVYMGAQTNDEDYNSEYPYSCFMFLYNYRTFVFDQRSFVNTENEMVEQVSAKLKDCYTKYTVKFTKHNSDEVINLPFYQVVADLDVNSKNSDTGGAGTEGWTACKGYFDEFYVYEDNYLTITETDEGMDFYGETGSQTSGEDCYYRTGLIAVTKNGEWSGIARFAPSCYNELAIYSDYMNIEDPVKTVTSTGSNSDGSFFTGDKVIFEVTQQMGEFYVDTFTHYTNLSIRDELPEGLTYQSAQMYDGDTLIADSEGNTSGADGTLSYEAGVVRFDFGEEWLAEINNYKGQTLKLIVTATVDNADKTELTNTAYSNFSEIEYGPAEATVEVKAPGLSISKVADKTTYGVNDTVEYTIDVSQTVDGAVSQNAVVSDKLPDGLTLQSVESDGVVEQSGNSFTVTFDEISDTSKSITVKATIDDKDLAGKSVDNTATVKDDYGNTDEDTATIEVLKPNVSINKSVSSGPYNVGDTVNYEMTITETVDGATDYDVVVTDALPYGLTATGNATSSKGEASVSGNTLTVSIPELASGETVTATFEATIGSGTAGGTVTNTAYVKDTYGNEDNDSADIEVLHPGLSIVKTVGSGPFNVGDSVTYTLTVTDPVADSVTTDVVVSDDLPDGLTATGNISLSGVDGDASVSGNTYKVIIPTLKYGETAVIEVEATIDADAVGKVIDNEAFATDAFDDNDRSDVTIEVLKPELSITKKADSTAYSIGDTVTYSIVVNQIKDGAIARNVVVTDTIPDQLELVSVDTSMGDASTSGNSFTVNCGDMSTSDTATITVTATALTESEDIVNTAYANADYTDEVSDDWKIAIRKPGLNIYKDADGEKYYPGDSVEYTLLVSNLIEGEDGEGNVPTAYNVVVSDTLPDGLTLVDVTAEGGTVEKDGNSFTVTYESMYYKAENTIKVTATVNDDVDNTTITNVATVKSDSTDPVDDYAEIDVIKPHLSIEKNADKDVYSIGGQVVYTIDVKQTIADLTAENVIIADTLPDEMELVSAELSGIEGDVSVDGNSFTVNAPALAFGETATVTVTANAKTANDSVVNTANADADHADPVSDDADVTILQPVLGIEKNVDKKNHYVGDSVVYTINVSETVEGGEAYDVVVSDTLPDGLELVDVTLNDIEGEVVKDGNSFTVSYDRIDSVNAAIITVEATALEEAANTTLNNMAYASASNADEVSDDADVYIGQPGLEITKTSDKDTYEVDETVTYTVTVAETVEGTSETNVTIYDELPDGLTIIGTPELSGADGSVSVSGNEVTVDIPELFYGEDAVLTIEAEAGESLAGETVTNTAYATGDHVDEISDDADISVVKPGETVDPDDPESTETPTSSSDPGETGSGVQTGDNSMMYILLGVAAILLMGGAYVLIQRRRRTE